MSNPNVTWYIRSRGRILGPFGFGQLEGLRNQGRLAKFDEVSQDRRAWVRADSMPELYPAMDLPPELAGASGSLPAAEPAEPVYALNAQESRVPGSAADEVSSWFYMSSQGQTGPVKLTELVRFAQTGVVGPETLIWTAAMGDWVPARTVPALGLAHVDQRGAAGKETRKGDGDATTAPQGIGLAVSSFILGLVGLITAVMFFVTSAVAASVRGNQDAFGIIFLTMWGVWGLSSLLAVVFGAIGMARSARDEGRRRGFGLAVTGLVLGIVGLVGFLFLLFVGALGVIAVAGFDRR